MQPRHVSRWYVLSLLTGGLVFGGLRLAWSAPPTAYTLTDLGAYAHPISIDPDSATVGGRRFVSESPVQQGVVWSPTATIIPSFPVAGDHNEVTGICGNIIVGNSGHAYRRTNGQFEDLGTTAVAGVNCAGTAVGYNPTAVPVPLVWTGTQATILPMLVGSTTGYALAINAHGDIIGESYDATNELHCTYWPVTGGVVDCHTPGVATRGGSQAQGINNAGQVVGQAGRADGSAHGFVWLPHTGMLLLPPLPGDFYSAAWGINDAGVIVGASGNAASNETPHAVRWDNGKPMDLLPLVTNAQGWTFDHAIAINNKGVIIGEGVVNGELHGFILTPQPPSRIPTPPVITIRATPDTLWPPNGKMVLVTIAGTITYAGSGVNPNTAAYVVTDEYRQVQPKGSVAPRADGNYSFTIQLQASRNGNDRDGRQYTITVSAHDLAGNEGVGTASVIVPHDQRN